MRSGAGYDPAMREPFDVDAGQAATSTLFFHCRACGDARPVSDARRYCVCERTFAQEIEGDEVFVAGPGRVTRSRVLERDHDEVPVRRPVLTVH